MFKYFQPRLGENNHLPQPKKPPEAKKSYVLGVALEPPLRRTIEAIARHERRSLSDVGRRLIAAGLAAEKKRRKAKGN